MRTEIRLGDHVMRPGEKVAEIFYNGKIIAAIYVTDGPAVKVMSKYLTSVSDHDDMTKLIEVKIKN